VHAVMDERLPHASRWHQSAIQPPGHGSSTEQSCCIVRTARMSVPHAGLVWGAWQRSRRVDREPQAEGRPHGTRSVWLTKSTT
jgi:hypothetical protein